MICHAFFFLSHFIFEWHTYSKQACRSQYGRAEDATVLQNFGRSVNNPISTGGGGVRLCPHITTSTPGCSELLTALVHTTYHNLTFLRLSKYVVLTTAKKIAHFKMKENYRSNLLQYLSCFSHRTLMQFQFKKVCSI